jgi:hypothetical protein
MLVPDSSQAVPHEPLPPELPPAGLFPLPLTSFERFVLADEAPDYPVTFQLQFTLDGPVDLSAVREALAQTLWRHPLLCSRIVKRRGRWHWQFDTSLVPEVQIEESLWRQQRPWQQRVDLRNEGGLRVWAALNGSSTIATLQFHHACCDGLGAAQFLEDLAVNYTNLVCRDTEPFALRELDPWLLRDRQDSQQRRVATIAGSAFRRARIMLQRSFRFLGSKIEQLQPLTTRRPEPADDTHIHSHRFDKAVTRQLRDVARGSNAQLNDLLIRDLMLTLGDWNTRAGGVVRNGRICLLIPTSLRGPTDDRLPAANVVGCVFLQAPRSLLPDARGLLRHVCHEMGLVHKVQGGWIFVQIIKSLQRWPGLFPLTMRLTRQRCLCTGVLSHLGNALNSISARLPGARGTIRFGAARLTDLRGVPALRTGTRVSVASHMFDGCLHVHLRGDPNLLGPEASEQLLQQFVRRLQLSARGEVLSDSLD